MLLHSVPYKLYRLGRLEKQKNVIILSNNVSFLARIKSHYDNNFFVIFNAKQITYSAQYSYCFSANFRLIFAYRKLLAASNSTENIEERVIL